MTGARSVATRVLTRVAAAALVLLAVALFAPDASGQGANVNLYACRRLDVRQIQAGTQVNYSQCGGQFTTADRYIAVVVHLRNVRRATLVLAELRDPDKTVVWRGAGLAAPPSGSDVYYRDLWVFGILPVGADASAVSAENPVLLRYVVQVQGKPARERVGEWTLRADVNNAQTTLKFQLQAAPGAPTPTPTPTPEATPSP